MTDRRGGGTRQRVTTGFLAVIAAGALSLVGTAPARAADRCVSPGATIPALPWAQQTLDPARVWPFSTGKGRTIAIVDTGIDADQPQLAGQVRTGTDIADGKGSGQTDCVGHGTQVAGVIGAKQTAGIGFRGLAPGASLMPVALTPAGSGQSVSGNIDPKALAKGIDWAVDHSADIVTVPYAAYEDNADLKAAVAKAHDHGVLIVAATGDLGDEQNPTPYPASYPGVLAIGTLAQDGTVSKDSGFGDFVGLVAPGASVVTTQAGHGQALVDGSAYAAGFASAVAALLWSAQPQLGVDALIHRLEATAAPGGEAAPGEHFGWGIADPYQALTGRTVEGPGHALPAVPRQHRDRAAILRQQAWSRSLHHALIGTGIGIGATLLIVAGAIYLPRGRRRRWRAGRAPAPHDDPEADTPTPPVHLFADPEPDRP